MPLDDETKAELRRSALGYVQRQNAAEDVPLRIRELRLNIERLEGRDGRAVETREQNQFELDQMTKLAVALDVPTELPEQEDAGDTDQPDEDGEAE